jgi:hypothetical protein
MNKITNAEEFLAQRYEVCKGREQKWQLDDMYRFAKEALCFARNEEREKAVEAFSEVYSRTLIHLENGEQFENPEKVFKELLNK